MTLLRGDFRVVLEVADKLINHKDIGDDSLALVPLALQPEAAFLRTC